MIGPLPAEVRELTGLLRDHGLRVDLVVVTRLGVLIGQLPEDPEEAARYLAAAVVVDPGDRPAALQAARAWLATRREPAPPEVVAGPPPVSTLRYATPAEKLEAALQRPRRRTWLWLGLLAVVAVALGWWSMGPPLPDGDTRLRDDVPLKEPPPERPRPTTTRPMLLPRIDLVEVVTADDRRTEAMVLAVAALLALLLTGLWLWWSGRRRPAGSDGLAALPPPPSARLVRAGPSAPLLLELDEQDEIVWAAAQHTIEVGTRRVDVRATVRATSANAGIPVLHYRSRRHALGIWLWQDEMARPPEVPRLADEIASTLAEAGLNVQRGRYYDVPSDLVVERGRIRPEDADESLRWSKVVILTDGVGWVQQLRGPSRDEALRVARELGTWRHVRVVCFDAEAHDVLRDELAPHGLEVLAPEQVTEAIGAGPPKRRGAQLQDLDRWAAVLALFPGAVSLREALELRHRLGLRVGALDWRELRPRSRGQGIHYGIGERIERVDWLRRTTGYDRWPEGSSDLLYRALDAWDEIVDEEGARGRITRLLLAVWQDPEDAAWQLRTACAADESQRERVRSELQRMVPADRAANLGGQAFVLPWRSTEIDAVALAWLRELGLESAFGATAARTRPPGRRVLALATLAGLALFSGAVAVFSEPAVDVEPTIRFTPDGAWSSCSATTCAAGTGDGLAWASALPGGVYEVTLEEVSRAPCLVGTATERIWRCTRAGVAAPLPEGRLGSYVLLQGGTDEERADAAYALLGTGSAVEVREVVEWPAGLTFAPRDGTRNIQGMLATTERSADAYRITSWPAFVEELVDLPATRDTDVGDLDSVEPPSADPRFGVRGYQRPEPLRISRTGDGDLVGFGGDTTASTSRVSTTLSARPTGPSLTVVNRCDEPVTFFLDWRQEGSRRTAERRLEPGVALSPLEMGPGVVVLEGEEFRYSAEATESGRLWVGDTPVKYRGPAGFRLLEMRAVEIGDEPVVTLSCDDEQGAGVSDDALVALQRSVDALERQAAETPADPSSGIELALAHERVGDEQQARGQLEDALTAYERGVDAAARVDDLPVLFRIVAKAGDVQRLLGRLDDAGKSYRRGLAIARKTGDERQLYTASTKLGYLATSQGQFKEAAVNFRQSVVIAEKLGNRDDLLAALVSAGSAEVALGRLEDAEATYRRATNVFGGSAGRTSPDQLRNVFVAYTHLGDVLVAREEPKAAREAYDEGLATIVRLTTQEPYNAQWLRDLSVAHERLGGVQLAQGQRGAALESYRERLAIVERLAAADPSSSPAWQRELWRAQWDLAEIPESGMSWSTVYSTLHQLETQGALDAEARRALDIARARAAGRE